MSADNSSDNNGLRIHGLSVEASNAMRRLLDDVQVKIKQDVQSSMEVLRNEIHSLTNLLLATLPDQSEETKESETLSPLESRRDSKESPVTINNGILTHFSGTGTMSGSGSTVNLINPGPPSSDNKSGTARVNTLNVTTQLPVTTNGNNNASATHANIEPKLTNEGLCPIDNRQRLPVVQNLKLDEFNVTPEKFELFAHRLLMELKAISKYDGILTEPIEESWEMCKERNASKYPIGEHLEFPYLELHQQVCVYIGRHISDRLFYTFNSEMKAENHDIPKELGFVRRHKVVHENAYVLWNKIRDRYAHKSVYKSGDLMDAWHNLRYDGRSDPRKFLNDYNEIHAQGRLTSVNFPLLNDTAKAQDIIRKCPNTAECSVLREKFLREDVTMAEVTQGLLLWHLEQKRIRSDRRSSIPSKSTAPPSGNRTPRSVMSTQENSLRRGRSPHKKDQRDPSRSRSRSEGRPRSRSASRNEEGSQTRTIENNDDEDAGSDPHYSFSGCCVSTPEGQSTDCPDSTFTGANNSGYYIPTRDEGIDDSGSDTVITPRLDLLDEVDNIVPIRISGIAGESIARKEGKLILNKHIDVDKVKYVPGAKFTILAVAPFIETGRFSKIYNLKGSYLIPSKYIPQQVLDEQSIFTTERKGKLYVFPLKRRSSESTHSTMGFYPNGKAVKPMVKDRIPSTAKSTIMIPKKVVPVPTVIRKLSLPTEEEKKIPTSHVHVPDASKYSVNVSTRPMSSQPLARTDSPYPDAKFHEDPVTSKDNDELIEQEKEPESPMTPYETSEY